MSRAYDNAADARFPSGRRNLIINGNFDVWQRGTSFSNPDNSYTADRFKVVSGGATTGDSVSQQSFTVGQTDVPGEPEYYLRFSAGSTSSNKVMHHRIEDVRTGAGQTCTLSFWAKASVAHSSTVEVAQNFGSGGSTQVALSAQSYSMTTSWQKFTFNFDLPSISGKTIGTSSYVYIAFIRSLPASNVDIDIAQMQFEVGNVATPFEHRSFGEELALCQRYYEVIGDGADSSTATIGMGYYYNASTIHFPLRFAVKKRTKLYTLDSTSGTNYYSGYRGGGMDDFNSLTLTRRRPEACLLYNTSEASGTTGEGIEMLLNSASAFVAIDDEL